jgi:hypothetical protein
MTIFVDTSALYALLDRSDITSLPDTPPKVTACAIQACDFCDNGQPSYFVSLWSL